MHRSASASLVVLCATALSACSDPPIGPPKELTSLPRPLTAAEQRVASSGNAFTFSLFKQVSAAQPDSNVFISPLSASMALGMAMNGANGATYDAMRAALGFDAAELADINSGYKGLIGLLRSLDRTTDFRIANSVWYRKELAVEPVFVTTVEDYFDARVAGLDFADPASVTTINTWVSDATASKIPTIIESIARDNVMFLINAIYFKGAWREPFDPKRTVDAQFHLADGTTQPMRLMNRKSLVRFGYNSSVIAADLPYGNSAFSMTVLLPRDGHDVNEVVASLAVDGWSSLMAQLFDEEVMIGLPRLTLKYERTLNDDLSALGMGVAFDDAAADFSRLAAGGSDFYISFVKQKTFVDINEQGTEAAAATAVGISVTSMPPSLTADRPFIFAIRERLTGTILFIGKIMRMP